MPDLVRVKLADGTETTVGAGYAESHGLKVLKDKPATVLGRTVRAKYPVDLRGRELDAALDAAGLSKTGTADEKRQRLADFQMSNALVVGEPTNPSGAAADTHEESE